MTVIAPSRPLAALGYKFTCTPPALLRLPPSSRWPALIPLYSQAIITRPTIVQSRRGYATQNDSRPLQLRRDAGVSAKPAQYAKHTSRQKSQLRQQEQPIKSQLQPPRLPITSSSSSGQQATTNLIALNGAINPPDSTRPAPVDTPTRAPDQNFFSHALKVGRAYWAFYKTGVKNVWSNNKLHKPLEARLQSYKDAQVAEYKRVEGRPPTAQELDDILSRQTAQFPLSRAEWQFCYRSARDFKKVPLFAGLLLVFGEWLPLVVVFCTPLVPYPCRIPTQMNKEQVKLAKRRSLSFRGAIDAGVPSPSVSQTSGLEDTHEAVRTAIRELDPVRLRHACRSLNLFFGIWDGTSVWPPASLLRLRLQRRWLYLRQDDRLLKRDGGVMKLKGEEIRIAAEERGIDTLNREDEELLENLKAWAAQVERKGLALLLSRPSVWTPESKK